MKKKIVGIFICMLFLFSTLPAIQGQSANLEKNREKPLLKTNDTFYIWFTLVWGKIEYNGEKLLEPPWGISYNITPIDVKLLSIVYTFKQGFNIQKFIVTENPSYISENNTHGFIGKHYMFLYNIISGKIPYLQLNDILYESY